VLLLSYIAFKWIRILASLHLGLVLYICKGGHMIRPMIYSNQRFFVL